MKTNRFHRGRAGWRLALLVGGLAGCLAVVIGQLVPGLELATLDARFRLRGVREGSDRIAVVEVDDQGLNSVSRWADYARVIRKLRQLGARLVVMDVVFRHAGDDADTLIEATRGGDVVLPVAVSLFPPGDWPANGAISADDKPVPRAVVNRAYPGRLAQGSGPLSVDEVLAPYQPLLEAARGAGQIGVVEDPDGVLRRLPLVVSLDGRPFPHVALEAARLLSGAEPSGIRWTGEGVEIRGRDGSLRLDTDCYGRVLLDYGGAWTDPVYDFVRAEDLLKPDAQDDPSLQARIKGRVCLVGVTGSGTTDLDATPFEHGAPRMLALATLFDQVLNRRFLSETGRWPGLILCLALALLIVWLSTRPTLIWMIGIGLAVLLSVPLVSCLLFVSARLVIPTAAPMLSVLLALVAGIALRLILAEQARRRVVALFGRYLSPGVLEKVFEFSDDLSDRGERKNITCLFSDIVGFSDYCDQVEPEEVRKLLNEYLEEMVDCVFGYEGTVDKFIGDGVLAFFGDPLQHDDHPERAVRSGLDMLARVERLNQKWHSEGRHTIQIRIGINTGTVVVGNIGSRRRLEYTVLGSQVNKAQRLESAARPGCLLMGEETWKLVRDSFPEAVCVGEVRGKREEHFRAYQLCGPAAEGERS